MLHEDPLAASKVEILKGSLAFSLVLVFSLVLSGHVWHQKKGLLMLLKDPHVAHFFRLLISFLLVYEPI